MSYFGAVAVHASRFERNQELSSVICVSMPSSSIATAHQYVGSFRKLEQGRNGTILEQTSKRAV